MSSDSSDKVIKAGAGYVIGNYLLKGITFLSAPIFCRLMSTAEYGDFNTYMSYEAIVYILLGLALHSSINNAKYKYQDKFEEYVSSIVLFMIGSFIVWIGAVNIFTDFFQNILKLDRVVLNILIVHCLSSSLLQVYNVYLSLNYSVKDFLKISSLNAISNMILSIILVVTFFQSDRCLGRIVGTVIPIGLIGLFIIIFFFRKARPIISREYYGFGLGYSLPIVPHGISQVILSTFDRIMIRDMVGSNEAGIYSFAYTVYTLLKVVVTSLENVWKPWIYERMQEKEYGKIRRQGTKFAFGMALFTTMVVLVAPEIIKILGRRDYWNSTNCVIPVVLGGYFAFLYTLPSMIEYYYEKTKFIAVGTMGAAALNVILNYFFIPRYGYIAAAYTTLFTYILYFVFHYCLARMIHGKSLYETYKLLGISVGMVAVGAVGLALENLWYIRWGLEIFLALYSFYWADKNFSIVSLAKKKLKI